MLRAVYNVALCRHLHRLLRRADRSKASVAARLLARWSAPCRETLSCSLKVSSATLRIVTAIYLLRARSVVAAFRTLRLFGLLLLALSLGCAL
mmetsp:Transcript_6208/g.12236  ORF Transcript_6208/g.12236 Transcript_6208/m.12236 type:complete len:93 (-) Transcript_6208:410-688(-)